MSTKFANGENKKMCGILRFAYGASGKPICECACCTRFCVGKSCAKHIVQSKNYEIAQLSNKIYELARDIH
jgi:hypothetical protein